MAAAVNAATNTAISFFMESPGWMGLLRAELRDQCRELVHLLALQVRERRAHGPRIVADQLGAGLDDADGVPRAASADLEVWHEEFAQQSVLRGHVVGAHGFVESQRGLRD